MNWLFWGVIALLILGVVVGYLQGVIKITMSLVSAIIAIVLVMFIAPLLTQFIINATPIDEAIATSFVEMIMEDTEQVVSESTEGEIAMTYPDLSLYEQIEIIEDSELPSVMQELLLTNNNSEIYSVLGVTDFVEYIGSYIAYWTIRVVSFLLTLLLVYFLIRTLLFSLDLIAEIPVIKEVNCGVGAVVGGVVALIVVWIGFIVMILFYQAEWSSMCLAWINESTILSILYQSNPIMKALFKM